MYHFDAVEYCLIGVRVCVCDLKRALNQNVHQNEWKKNQPQIEWHLLKYCNCNHVRCVERKNGERKRKEARGMKGGRKTNDPLCLSFCRIRTLPSACFIHRWTFVRSAHVMRCVLLPRLSLFLWPLIFLSIECISSKMKICSTWKHTNNTHQWSLS